MTKKVAERVGRLKERHSVAARHYAITMEVDDKQNKVESLTAFKKQAHEECASLNVCYVIETSHKELTAKVPNK